MYNPLIVVRRQMWATPETCLTHKASGLPVGRRVSSYCFAPPCVVSPRLSAKAAASGLIISFVYGHDIVSRLSLGSVRDLTRGAVWLCAAENRDETQSDGYNNVTKKALKCKMGRQEEGDEEWVSSSQPYPQGVTYALLPQVPCYPQDSRSEHADGRPVPSRPRLLGTS